MLKNFSFNLPTKIEFGNGKVNKLGDYIKELQGEKILIITDKGLLNAGVLDSIFKTLEKENIEHYIYDNVKPNPRDSDCMEAYELAKEKGVDLLIGVGGGSSMDTAKAVGTVLSNGGDISDWYGLNKLKHPITPLICIPTTAGTGSEITFFSVITNTSTNLKMNILDINVAPKIAILDPELTVSLPPLITASTGMDALTHAIEAYTCNLAEPITDALALYAIELIVKNLEEAVTSGNNIEARENMLAGSLIAGIAFGNADVGGVHCMAEALGGLYDTPHGIANSILLPYVFDYNIPSNVSKHAKVAILLGADAKRHSSDEDIAKEGVKILEELAEKVGIPKMKDIKNVNINDFDYLAESATKNVSATSNPREASKEDYLSLFYKSYNEELPLETVGDANVPG